MGEPRLNVRWPVLVGLVVAGLVLCQSIAMYVPTGSHLNAYLFSLFSLYGIFFAYRGIRRGVGFIATAGDTHLRVDKTLAVANLRREILRGVAHLNVLLIGVLAIDPPAWFGRFFVAAMFFLVYTMDVNSTLDDTLKERVKRAHALDTKEEVQRMKRKKGG